MNNTIIDKLPDTKILGVWVSQDTTWGRHCKETCKKAYYRLSVLTKLKYVGTNTKDLLDIYTHLIRSVVEYCSVVFHSRLTIDQSDMLERIQRTCLKVILGDRYENYDSALEMSGLERLFSRREQRCLDFILKYVKQNRNRVLFPVNTSRNGKAKEKYVVNWARTEAYRNSTVPYCQRLLNKHFGSVK